MLSPTAHPSRVAIVGVGNVGATFAYALLLSGLASEIVLIDANHGRAQGEAADLSHAVPFSKPTRIWAGDYDDCSGAAATVITAGAAQVPGEDRLALVRRNDTIFATIVPQVARANPDGIVVVATNPVDVLAYRTFQLSGLPPERVLGSGTILDTARFRSLLAAHFDVDARSVHAYIIGEHGDSEVPVWSSATIGGMHLGDYCAGNDIPYETDALQQIFTDTRDAAYAIIRQKGATYYAVAAGLMRITEAILRDQNTVLPVSTLVRDYYGIDDIYLSLPAIVGRRGIARTLRLALTPEEALGLRHSAGILRTTLASLEAVTEDG